MYVQAGIINCTQYLPGNNAAAVSVIDKGTLFQGIFEADAGLDNQAMIAYQ
jgi:hypothetical protein